MDELRRTLTTYAYNILGVVEDAKDVVQDAYMKFSTIDQQLIEDKRAYLIRTVINLSINLKKKRQKQLPEYRGQWLPEPVAAETADAGIIGKETLTYSLMTLLEKLNPKHRAVFILKEAYDYSHEEIADAIGISSENSRKILTRARDILHQDAPVSAPKQQEESVGNYVDAMRKGDLARLEKLLNHDIELLSDGGGKVSATLKPLVGRKTVVAFVAGVFRKFYQYHILEQGWVNQQPAIFYYHEGKMVNCQVFTVRNGEITNIYFMRNPDKLKFLQKNP